MPGIVNTRILLAPTEEHTKAKANSRKAQMHSVYTIVAKPGLITFRTDEITSG